MCLVSSGLSNSSPVGGNNVSPGYYKLKEKTKEDFFTEDGVRWFRTGDIGEYYPDGVIRIIGIIFLKFFRTNDFIRSD